MSNNQQIAGAIADLCDAVGITSDKRREALEDVLAKWIDTLPTIEAEHAKDDRLYWVRTPGSDWKRKAFRIGGGECLWRVDGQAGLLTDAEVTVLGEVERDDDTPNHPEVLNTVEDYRNAPEWTVIARDHLGPFVKFGGIWRNTLGEVISNELLVYRRDGGSIPVLRWGPKCMITW